MTLRRQILLLLGGLAAALVATVGMSTAAHADTTPSAPTGVGVWSWMTEGSSASAYVSWAASSSNGGSALTYTVTPRIGSTPQTGLSVSTSGTAAEVTGLAPGTTYSFEVKATNLGGLSATSSPSSAITTMTAGTSPTSVSASGSGANATVTWTASSALGSGNFSTYIVEAYSGGTVAATGYASGTSYTFTTGLTPGTSYTFKVTLQTYDPATWNIAWSNPSSASNSVITYVAPSAPTAVNPQSFFTDGSSSSAVVNWSASSSTGGGSLTYTVTPRIGSTLQTGLAVTTTGTIAEVTGLTPGTAYTFVVTATNTGGQSATSSPSSSITTMTAATSPTAVSASASGGNATVTWTAPSSLGSGGFSTYVVQAYSGSTLATSAYESGTSHTFTSLTPGTAYTFKVVQQTYDPATWNIAWSAPSSASNSVTPYVAPAVPTGATLNSWFTDGSSSSAVVRWTASSSTGGGSLTYTLTPLLSGVPQTGLAVSTTGTTAEVTGLTPGTAYTFAITATNTGGQSTTSSPSSSITTMTAATAPTAVSASASGGNATVTWTAPSSLGSGSFSTYIVQAYSGSTLATSSYESSTSHTFTSLTPGTSYTFKVIQQTYDPATWNIAWSAASSASNAVTPYVAPSAPTGATLNSWFTDGSSSSAVVRWTASSSTGGGSLTYTVTPRIGSTLQTGLAVSTTGTTAEATGLTPGTTYTFVVTATNTGGQSATSSPSSSVTPLTAAGAPTSVSAGTSGGNATVTWTAPGSLGSGSFSTYIVEAYSGSTLVTSAYSSSTSSTFTSLTPGTAYTFKVITQTYDPATWNIAWSDRSSASNSVTP